MKRTPKTLSIVVPAYNESSHLRACLDAIIAQTQPPNEVIVVDNNSSDDTADIARSYPFVKVIPELRQGKVFARNAGFDAAKGELIGRIDADTILPATWVAEVRAFFDEPAHERAVFTGGCFFYNLHSGQLTGRLYDLVVHRLNRLLLGHYFPWGSNSALPAEAWRAVRGHVCLTDSLHEDLDLGVHLERAGFHAVYRSRVRVGAEAKRIMSGRGELWPYLAMWPHTFRAHHIRKWWLIWPLAVGVWASSYGIFMIEKAIALLG